MPDWEQYAEAPSAATPPPAQNWEQYAEKPEQSLRAGVGEYTHQMGGFFEGLYNKAKSAVGALVPGDPSKAAVDAPIRVLAGAAEALHNHVQNLNSLRDKAEESLSKGEIADFIGHLQTMSVEGMLPGVGQAADAAKAKWDAGDKVGATADAAALTSQMLLGAKSGDLMKAGLNAGAYGIAATRAAGPGVAAGLVKAGAGELLAKVPGMEWPGRIGLQYPAVRQIAKAFGKGAEAGRAAIAPEAEAEAATPARPGAVAPAAASPPVAEDTELLNGLSQFYHKKTFAKLNAEQQATIRDLASRGSTRPTFSNAPATAAEATPQRPTLSSQPAAQPAPAAPTPATAPSALIIPSNKFEPAVGGEDQGAVNMYREMLRNGQDVPPVEAAYHPSTERLNVIDGYHRLAAYRAEGLPVKTTITNAAEFPNEVQALSSSKAQTATAAPSAIQPNGAPLRPPLAQPAAVPARATPPANVTPIRPQAPASPPPASPQPPASPPPGPPQAAAVVPEQLKTSGRTFVKDSRPSAEDYTLMEVPTAKIDAGWAKEGPAFYIPPGGGGAEIGGRMAGAQEFIQSGKPIQAPRISMSDDGTGRIVFEDGRHRFSALRDSGDKTTAVMVPNEQLAQFEALNKANGPATASTAPTAADVAKAATAKGKGQRFVAAIQRYNVDFPDREPITATAWEAFGDKEKSILTRALKNGGYLKNTETFTDTSSPYILQGLRDAESGANLEQQLAESIKQAQARRAAKGR